MAAAPPVLTVSPRFTQIQTTSDGVMAALAGGVGALVGVVGGACVLKIVRRWLNGVSCWRVAYADTTGRRETRTFQAESDAFAEYQLQWDDRNDIRGKAQEAFAVMYDGVAYFVASRTQGDADGLLPTRTFSRHVRGYESANVPSQFFVGGARS